MAFELTIVTPSGEAFSGAVESVVLPGEEGDFGVLPGHERFLAALREGPFEIREGNASSGTRRGEVSSGFADVSGEHVTVLVDRCSLE